MNFVADFNLSMRWTVFAQLISNLLLTSLIFIAARKFYFMKFDSDQFKSLLNLNAWSESIYMGNDETKFILTSN